MATALAATAFTIGGTAVSVGTTVAVAGAALSAGLAITSANAQADQAKYQSELAAQKQEFEARQMEEDAALRRAEAQQSKRDRARRLRAAIGGVRSAYGASGTTLEGSPTVQIESTLAEEAITQDRIQRSADIASVRLNQTADFQRSVAGANRRAGSIRASNLRTSGYLNAAGSLFSSFNRIAQRGQLPSESGGGASGRTLGTTPPNDGLRG